MTTPTKVLQSDIEFVLDVFRRSKPGKRLTAGQVVKYCYGWLNSNQVYATLDKMIANVEGSLKCDAAGKYYLGPTLYKPAEKPQDARKQPAPDNRAGLYRLPFYHPIMQ